MDELLGILFELFLELFINIFGEILAEIITRFVNKVEADSKLKNRIKMIVSFTFFGLSILLLIIALIYKKTFLITLTLSYLLILLISNLFKFTNKNIWKKNSITLIINWIRRITHYGFTITLIVTGSLFLTNTDAKVWLITLSVIAIIIYLIIDIYKANVFLKKEENINITNITNKIKE